MKWTFYALLTGCVFLFCRTSCQKIDCLGRLETIPDGVARLQNPSPLFSVGDTIRLIQEVSYSNFSRLPLQMAELRRLQGTMSFYILKIVDSVAKGFNAVSAQQAFTGAATAGILQQSTQANSHSYYYLSFLQDSVNARLVSHSTFVGKEPGTYAFVMQTRFFNFESGQCDGNYDIRQKIVWQQPSNEQLAQSRFINGKIKYRVANGQIADLDPATYGLFYFRLQ